MRSPPHRSANTSEKKEVQPLSYYVGKKVLTSVRCGSTRDEKEAEVFLAMKK